MFGITSPFPHLGFWCFVFAHDCVQQRFQTVSAKSYISTEIARVNPFFKSANVVKHVVGKTTPTQQQSIEPIFIFKTRQTNE